MGKYQSLAQDIVKYIGGAKNVEKVGHCVTRLRLVLKDNTKANKQALEALPGVAGVFEDDKRFQVVLGSKVDQVYEELRPYLPMMGKSAADGAAEATKLSFKERFKPARIVTLFADTIAGCFVPVVLAAIGACMITSVRILLGYMGLLQTGSDFDTMLGVFGDCVFYFLPFLVAVGAAERFKCNKYIAMAIVGVLMHPTFTALTAAGVEFLALGSLKVYLYSYSATVIPIILSVYVLSKVEKLLTKIIPDAVHAILIPFLELAVVGFAVLAFIGPAGLWLNGLVSKVFFFLFDKSGILASTIVGACYPLLVVTGTHSGLYPIIFDGLATRGYDVINALVGVSNAATAGAALAVFLKSKNRQVRATASSSAILAAIGLTEPALFGVTLRFKKPLIASIIAGAFGGAAMGFFKVYTPTIGFAPLGGLPIFFGPTFVPFIVSVILVFALACGLAYMMGFDDPAEIGDAEESGVLLDAQPIASPLSGNLLPLADVNDGVFSRDVLGVGVAMIPTEGIVRAPFDGIITAMMDSSHAVGISSENGMEVLVHIGIDTINLGGKYFKSHVKKGQTVKQGDVLLEFDIEGIKASGFNIASPVVVTNWSEYQPIKFSNVQKISCGEALSVQA